MEAFPSNRLGQRLCETFSYRWRWLEASLETNIENPKWTTNTKHPIKPRSLWVKYQDAQTIIGVRFGKFTEYALLDLDAESVYLGQVERILEALETIGICRVVIVRSSWSGGVHLYCPLPRPMPTFSVAVAVATALEAQGIHLQPGQIEAFPNVKTYAKNWLGQFSDYNGHRLPLQPGTGSCLLNKSLEPIQGGDQLSRFFALWDNALLFQDAEVIDQAVAIARSNRRRRRRSVGPVESWRDDLRLTIEEGWTGPGQTNHLLKEIGCYGRVFEGLSGVELAEYIERVATNSPGYERYCSHQHEIWKRCCVWGKAVEGYYWPLGAEPLRERRTLASVREDLANDARRRIAAAVAELGAYAGNIKQMARQLCQMARTSQQTLYKNRDLWNPSPPPPADQPQQPVTDQAASGVGPLGAIRQQILDSLESADLALVTPNGGRDETWALKTCPLKNLNSGRGGGGAGEEGLSTGPVHG